MNVPVSVIIPCYCSVDTIARTVASVAKQTLKPAELIIVDDCSNDNTKEVLQRLQNEYGKNWIKLEFLEKNSGPSVARNKGWELASQEYIAFLDADDAWHPSKIAVQYLWMIEHPEVVLTAHARILGKSYEICSNFQVPEYIEAKFVSKYQILSSNKFFTSCVMLKNNIYHRFSIKKKYSEDYLLWLEIMQNGGISAILNCPLAIYFKEYFGEAGLSSKLWEMERSELDNYKIIWKKGYISSIELFFFSIWSFTKYLRRLLITNIRK